jgi:hypothetical protein
MAKAGLNAKRPTAPRTYQHVAVNDLSGGLDLRRSPTLLGADRARTLTNYSIATPGEIAVRPGYQAFSSISLGSTRGQGGVRAYLANTVFTLFAWGGAVYKVPDSGPLPSTARYSTISESNQVFFPYDRTIVSIFDGANRPRLSTDGSTWVLHGIDASPSSCSVSSQGGGSLSGSEFEFTFSYKHRGTGHESNISTKVSTVTLSSTGAVGISVPNSTDGKVDAICLYGRNKTAGEAVLRKISSAAAQGGGASTYTITSSAWSANDEAPTNHNVPGAYRFGVVWKNRWWAADGTVGNRLHFSELFQNQSFPTLFYIDIPFEKGDEITALIPQGDTLLVFGQSKVFLVIGQTSLDFEVRPSAGAQAGALGPRAVAAIENGIVHASGEGIHIYDGASDRLLTFDIQPAWRDLVRNSPSTALELVSLVHHFPYQELRVSVPRRYPTADPGEFVLDLNRTRESQIPAWAATDRTISGYVLWDGDEPVTGNRGRLLSWSPTVGMLFEESTGTTANSSNMVAEYEGPHLATGLNRARFVDHYGEYEPHSGAFTAEVVVDGISQGQQSITIGAGLATYGSAVYGTGQYAGAGRRMYHRMLPVSAEGRTVWLRTSYSGQEAFRQFTYSVGLVPETSPRGFSE